MGIIPKLRNHSAISTFPLLGEDIPPLPTERNTSNDREYKLWLGAHPPHWFTHLCVTAHSESSRQFKPPALPSTWLSAIGEQLGMDSEGRSLRTEFEHCVVQLREYLATGNRTPSTISPLSFHFKPDLVNHTSFMLALAMAAAAAVTGRPLPSWVTFTGCMHASPDEKLELLTNTDGLDKKIRLCLGFDEEFDLRPLMDEWYQYESATRELGPRKERTVSGGVRLLVCPRHIRGWDERVQAELCVVDLDLRLDAHELSNNPERLLDQLEEVAGDDLVIAEVPTLWHALGLLGFAESIPLVGQTLDEMEAGTCQFRRVGTEFRESEGDPEAYIDRLIDNETRRLQTGLKDTIGVFQRLDLVTRRSLELLEWEAGFVAYPSDNWYRVVGGQVNEDSGLDVSGLPPALSSEEPLIQAVMEQRKPVVIRVEKPREHHEKDYLVASVIGTLYKEDAKAKAYLNLMKQCPLRYGVPLIFNHQIYGVLCLLGTSSARFINNLRMPVVWRFGDNCAEWLAEHFADEELRAQLNRPSDLLAEATLRSRRRASFTDSHRTISELTELCEKLCQDLAERAREFSTAYRVTVNLVDKRQRMIVLTGLAQDEVDRGPVLEEETLTVGLQLSRQIKSAFNEALNSRRTYLIPDTRRTDIRFRSIQPFAAAHMSIPLKGTNGPFGVVGVDFDESHRSDCNSITQRSLEVLVSNYSHLLDHFRGELWMAEMKIVLGEPPG